MKRYSFVALATVAILCGALQPARAQWQTQTLLIKPGWTAVYLHVDASYVNLDALIGSDPNNPIAEVWMWQPAGTIQYVTSPLNPTTGSSQWATWQRLASSVPSTLATLVPNAAFLIHSLASTNYLWKVKGQPVAPSYIWATTGFNLLGFPTSTNNPPALDTFLSLQPAFASAADIYQYTGGDLGPANPFQIFALHTVPVTRGQAFWVRSSTYFDSYYVNSFFGPFQVGVSRGLSFSNTASALSFHLSNPTPFPVTVKLNLLPSEDPPAGQAPIAGLPPLLVRGALAASNLTYSASNLTTSASQSWTLPPRGQAGSDIVIVLGVNRAAFTGNARDVYAGILRFTDSNNYTEVDVPVSASPSSYTGLWVGSAVVSRVANYLKSYQLDTNGSPLIGANGAYVVTNVNTSLGPVANNANFSMRLILHNDGNNVVLLQRVFYGADVNSNLVLATSESLLDQTKLSNARRLTAVQFPWTADNQTWPFSGHLVPGATLTTTVPLDYGDQANNPFLHTYHPDHDNLTADFKREQPRSVESYDLNRVITLSLGSTGADFASLTQFGQSFKGNYSETITLSGSTSRAFNVSGGFSINHISSIAVLSHP
jgi:hypothetical protein